MKKRGGFTLTEVLMAVMIVGIIGVALAALTSAASRHTDTGNSRVMLRNNLSVAMRELRQDVHEASRVVKITDSFASRPTTVQPLFVLAKQADIAGSAALVAGAGTKQYVAYCFTSGTRTTFSSGISVQPSGNATDGGVIERISWEGDEGVEADYCNTSTEAGKDNKRVTTWLKNVKFISSNYVYTVNAVSHIYPVPQFYLTSYKEGDTIGSTYGKGNVLNVRLILELNSLPVINEAVEEQFLLSVGGGF